MTTKYDLNEKEVHKLLTDDATYATVLLAICLTAYPEDLFDIDSLELYARLQEDFGAAPTDDNKNKLQALMVAISTPYFYINLHAFKTICNSLLEGDPGIGELDLDDPTMLEILWALYEVNLVSDDLDLEFSPGIERFINETVLSVAEDREDLDVEDVVPEHEAAMLHMIVELKQQLKLIFEKVPELPPLVN